jgi:cytochrome bd-type quinol oxidase subunit 2
MSEQIKKTTSPATSTQLFDKGNYMWMLIGLGVIVLGFFLMAGGKSSDPKVFNKDEVYSATRITIAPLLIIAGFIIEIFAIMKKSKAN